MSSNRGPEFFAACEGLISGVSIALKRHLSEEVDQPLVAEQVRYADASMVMAQALKVLGQNEASNKFQLLAEALLDVAEGLPHPLFSVERPKAAGGRRPDTTAVWRTRSTLCTGVQYLMAGANVDEDKAIDLVLKRHRTPLEKLKRPGANLKSSIQTWMKSFANDEVKNEVALRHYKANMKNFLAAKSASSGASIKQAGENLIAGAAERAARLP